MDFAVMGLPTTVALAAVALLGYIVGRGRKVADGLESVQARRELKRARCVVRELETIAAEIRASLATHHASIVSFKDRVADLSQKKRPAPGWSDLSAEAERMLAPTMRLSHQIAQAYDEIRRQTNSLMTFTEVRTDPLTGLSNRRAFEETLAQLLALLQRYGNSFAIAVFDIDHFKKVNDEHGHLHGDQVLKQIAQMIDDCVRDTDIAVRYGGEEFVVIMPQTDLTGAATLCERIRGIAQQRMPVTLSCGIAVANGGDTPRSLVGRADTALYAAKEAGRNRTYHSDAEGPKLWETAAADAPEADDLATIPFASSAARVAT